MMPEKTVSKIMRAGLTVGISLMFIGVIVTMAGSYSEGLKLSLENLMNGKLITDGAGLMYLGTVFIILTPVAVLIMLAAYYAFSKTKRYALYCLLILAVLIIVVMMRYN